LFVIDSTPLGLDVLTTDSTGYGLTASTRGYYYSSPTGLFRHNECRINTMLHTILDANLLSKSFQQFSIGCKNTNAMIAAAKIVMIIANVLGLSEMIPIIPKISDKGIHPNISNPPRAAMGLPQPGLKTIMITMVATATENNFAEIFPNRMDLLSFFGPDKSRL